MKKHLFYISTLILLIATSCNSDELICETDEPGIPQIICDTGLLVMRSDGETGEPRFSLDSISKPITTPLIFENIRQDQQDDSQFDVFNRPSNYDAYNSVTNQYFIEFPLQQRLYKYDINSQTRQELIVAGFYSAPVFNNGILYTITIDNFGYATNPANYSIETIDQNSGALTTQISGSFTLTSTFNWESMSSAKDGNGNLYFVSGTNLISYNIADNTATQFELTPNFDFVDNFQKFYALEMRNNGNLLAIRQRDDLNGEGLELVEINSNSPAATPTVIFDFMANGIALNSEFYSSTYDVCDDTYYITSRRDATTTDFYEIDLTASTFKTENFGFYLMGIESKNN